MGRGRSGEHSGGRNRQFRRLMCLAAMSFCLIASLLLEASAQVAVVSEVDRQEFVATLEELLPETEIRSGTSVTELKSTFSPGFWVCFEPSHYGSGLDDVDAPVIWMANTRSEREQLRVRASSTRDVVLLNSLTHEACAESLLMLFPLAKEVAIVATDIESLAEVEAIVKRNSDRFREVRDNPAIRLPVQLRGVDLVCFAGSPGSVSSAVREASGTGIPLVTLGPPPPAARQIVASLTVDPEASAQRVAGVVRILGRGGTVFGEGEAFGETFISADLESIRESRFHINVAAFEVWQGELTGTGDELDRVDDFLDRYRSAVSSRDVAAYINLWQPGRIEREAIDAFRRLTESTSELEVELRPPRVLDYSNEPESLALYVGQWFHYVDRASARKGSLPRTVVRFELLRENGTLKMSRQGRAGQ